MEDIKQTQSYANVVKELESRGRNMILLNCFAERARAQGYYVVAAKLDSIARQEREHCRVLYRITEEREDIDTLANLIYAAGELHRSSERLGGAFAAQAGEEGLNHLSSVFSEIAKTDARTEEDLKAVMSELKVGKLYLSDGISKWQCMKCGCTCEGGGAPEICPLCSSQKGFYFRR